MQRNGFFRVPALLPGLILALRAPLAPVSAADLGPPSPKTSVPDASLLLGRLSSAYDLGETFTAGKTFPQVQVIPAITATINGVATVSGPSGMVDVPSVSVGRPIRLRLHAVNTTARTVLMADSMRFADWNPEVDWLGPGGLGMPLPARLTAAGQQQILPAGGSCCVGPLPPGTRLDSETVTLTDLYDMSRPGVYVIRVSHWVSFTETWDHLTKFAASPVTVVVR